MDKPLSTEEVYFLVRVGSWDQQQLAAWVNQCHEYAIYSDGDFEEIDDRWFDYEDDEQ